MIVVPKVQTAPRWYPRKLGFMDIPSFIYSKQALTHPNISLSDNRVSQNSKDSNCCLIFSHENWYLEDIHQFQAQSIQGYSLTTGSTLWFP